MQSASGRTYMCSLKKNSKSWQHLLKSHFADKLLQKKTETREWCRNIKNIFNKLNQTSKHFSQNKITFGMISKMAFNTGKCQYIVALRPYPHWKQHASRDAQHNKMEPGPNCAHHHVVLYMQCVQDCCYNKDIRVAGCFACCVASSVHGAL